jgi:hypothetical protein
VISAEVLKRDLGVFADPATEPTIIEGQQDIDVLLTRDAEEVRFTIERRSGRVTIRGANLRRLPSVASLLADPLFANIRSLTATQRQINATFSDAEYIEAEGEVTHGGRQLPLDLAALEAALSPAVSASGKIRVVLLDGPAGVGKTSLIHRLLVHRSRGANAAPIVHVLNRGSRLFGLNQLLAASLDTLRAKFTFDQTPVLLRYGLLQVAVDGFDELVDSEGYADAWVALSDFLNEIGDSGGVILAGRDTFFDQQVFAERLEDIAKRVEFIGARLKPIRPARARSYLTGHGWAESELASGPGLDVLQDGSYTLRPYFLRTLADAQPKQWVVLLGGRTLRSFLVDSFLRREARLVSTKTNLTQERAIERLRDVFADIALEMAASETSAIDTAFIELVVEEAFLKDVSASDIGRLKYKAGSLGFLEQDDQKGYRRFPHTEVSHHFLALGVIRDLGRAGIRRVLSRANFEGDFLTIFSEVFAELLDAEAEEFLQELNRLLDSERSSYDRFESNIAALWIATLSRPAKGGNRVLTDRQMDDAVIVGMASPARLARVIVNRFDLRGADVSEVVFDECESATMVVDADTRVGQKAPTAAHLQIVMDAAISNVRGNKVQEWLEEHSVKPPQDGKGSEAETLLLRVGSTLQRRYAIRDSEEDPAGRLFRHRYWGEIEKILGDRLVRVHNRGAGRSDYFVRIRDPYGLMRASDPASVHIWEQVRKLR